jgi:tetratricopeptide (TPR) repeat protein
MADLTNANLAGADLTRANLSRANLQGANLTNANLSGASFHGANLTGANLTGATLVYTDLRNAYVVDADFSDTDLSTTYVNGTVGIPSSAVSAEQFYQWALIEDKKGNYSEALQHYHNALELDPQLSPAYLARGLIQARYGRNAIALNDFQTAQKLFKQQENEEGYNISSNFIELLKTKEESNQQNKPKGSRRFVQTINGIMPLLFRFLLF